VVGALGFFFLVVFCCGFEFVGVGVFFSYFLFLLLCFFFGGCSSGFCCFCFFFFWFVCFFVLLFCTLDPAETGADPHSACHDHWQFNLSRHCFSA